MTLAKMIRKARLSKDVTLKTASSEMGISPSHLHAIERGSKPRPKMVTIAKMALYFAISHDDVCIAARRIPEDVFYKIIDNPKLLTVIREYTV